jgi:hypothetical protein
MTSEGHYAGVIRDVIFNNKIPHYLIFFLFSLSAYD